MTAVRQGPENRRTRSYGAESPAEFFAVASETFFMNPVLIAEDFPAVYRQLRVFYGQDPLAVLGQGSGQNSIGG
jgi:Mlc titration factor MtfA (ptsG expression regulator)